jgi:hypothetical protein
VDTVPQEGEASVLPMDALSVSASVATPSKSFMKNGRGRALKFVWGKACVWSGRMTSKSVNFGTGAPLTPIKI